MALTDLDHERPKRILVIEDSELDRLWLRHRLRGETLQVLEAPDGLAGLEICRTDPPDLVLLDLGLPFCDGFEVLKRLKDDRRTMAVPVIVVSATSDTADKARGLDLGAVDFVTKPYDLIELQARIRVAFRTKRIQDLLEKRAHIDGLSGLANRRALEERMQSEWAFHQRHGGPLAVLIADLDHFKQVNDRYGHAAGDEVLRRVAEALSDTVRNSDMAARYGGEEFVAVAARCDTAGILKTAERFRHRLAMPPAGHPGHEFIRVTVSIGVAAVPDQAAGSAAELLARADEALYAAKALGRDRVVSRGDMFPYREHNGRAMAEV